MDDLGSGTLGREQGRRDRGRRYRHGVTGNAMLSLPLSAPAGEPLSLLAIGAHPDDIEIGAGGLLLGLAESGLRTRYVVLTGTEERRQEARNAAHSFMPGADLTVEFFDLPEGRLPAVWGSVKEILEDVARSFSPDVIIAPSSDDAHQDHRTIAEIVPTVFRDQLYLAYEIPKWDGDIGRPSMYVPLPAHVMQLKVELLHKCFPVAAGPGLVGRRGLPRSGATARHGVPGALRRGVHMHQISDRARGVRARQRAGEGSVMNIVIDPGRAQRRTPADAVRRAPGHPDPPAGAEGFRRLHPRGAHSSCSSRTTRSTCTSTSSRPRWRRSSASGSPGTSTRRSPRSSSARWSRRLASRLRRTTTICRSRGRPSRWGTSTPGWPSPSRGTATPGTAHPPSRSTGGCPSSRCATTTP